MMEINGNSQSSFGMLPRAPTPPNWDDRERVLSDCGAESRTERRGKLSWGRRLKHRRRSRGLDSTQGMDSQGSGLTECSSGSGAKWTRRLSSSLLRRRSIDGDDDVSVRTFGGLAGAAPGGRGASVAAVARCPSSSAVSPWDQSLYNDGTDHVTRMDSSFARISIRAQMLHDVAQVPNEPAYRITH